MTARAVNNDVYLSLGERWYEAHDDPIALLRAQTRLHAPWIDGHLARSARVLDVGCGGGILANALAARGHDVTGVDLAAPSLDVARRHGTARYVAADARALPFADASFDAACAMDFLEHVEEKDAVVGEIARVLVPGGLFFFHTFDRTPESLLVVIKGVEWFVRNVPQDLHLHRLFLRPRELRAMCEARGLSIVCLHGCVPRIDRAFFRMLSTGNVTDDFAFRFSRGTRTGYSGIAARHPATIARRTAHP